LSLQTELIEVGNHSIAIYSDINQKINETLEYLKKGVERNESLIFITADISKEEVRNRIENQWKVNVDQMEEQGDILLQTPEEWYFREGSPNWRRTDAMFLVLQSDAVRRGKSGLRGAGDTRLFFERGYVNELVEYEASLERKFTISFTPLCTYSRTDFDSLTPQQVTKLTDCHYHFVTV
jgi:hypothetical protein